MFSLTTELTQGEVTVVDDSKEPLPHPSQGSPRGTRLRLGVPWGPRRVVGVEYRTVEVTDDGKDVNTTVERVIPVVVGPTE